MSPARTSAGFHLESERTSIAALVRETIQFLPLARLLARKEFHVRYRRASLGMAWAVALPLLQAMVLAAVVSRVARFDIDVPLAVFIFAGTLPFSQVTGSLSAATTSIVDNTGLSSRVYFPRAVLPLMIVGSNVYGLATGLVALAVLAAVTGATIGPEIVLLVPAVAVTLALVAGLALTTSALHVYFRDVKYLVSAGVTVWFYGTPIFYPLEALEGTARAVVVANPATGMVQLYRAALGVPVPSLAASLAVTVGATTVLFLIGLVLHARWDRVFADLL